MMHSITRICLTGLPSVRRIPSTGDLLFVWISGKQPIPGSPGFRRTPLTTAISKDEGKTFEHFRNLAEDPNEDYGYQSVDFLGDDLALIAFHVRDGMRLARVGIDWFYEK